MSLTAYQKRVIEQTQAWVDGTSIHNYIDNECTLDFSCCVPDLFEKDKQKRINYFIKLQQQYGLLQ